MSRMVSWERLLLSAALCGALLPAVQGCNRQQAQNGGAPGQREATPVRIGAVTVQNVPVQLSTFGNVEAYSTIHVKAQVSGELKEVHFKEGDVVQEGQLLFTIDPRPFEAALTQAQANMAKAEAQLEEARANKARNLAQAANAEAELNRDAPLHAQGMVSQEEFDRVRTNAEALRAAVSANDAAIRAATEAIQSAKAAIEQASLQLEYCTIRAPITARTGSLLLHRGNLVRANDTNPMVVLTQMQPIYVAFTVSEKHLPAIREHMAREPLEVTAVVPDHEEMPVVGTLTFIDNEVEQRTGTIRVKATFENADGWLWPGQYVTVELRMAVQEDAVVAPSAAIQMGQTGMFAYVVRDDMTVELRQVATGDTWKGLTVIREGLTPGESVVTDGLLRAAPGVKVRIVAEQVDAGGRS